MRLYKAIIFSSLWFFADDDMSYDIPLFTDRYEMGIEETVIRNLFQVLDSMVEKFYFELILILFPDEFTSLDEMSDNPYSSRFQYPIDFMEKSFYIFDMLENEKTGCKIEGFVIEGEWLLQIANDFLYFACVAGMSVQELFSDITSDIFFRFQGRKVFEQSPVASS